MLRSKNRRLKWVLCQIPALAGVECILEIRCGIVFPVSLIGPVEPLVAAAALLVLCAADVVEVLG